MIKYVRNQSIEIEKLSDEIAEDILVINGETDTVLVLNYTAAIILNMLESPIALGEISKKISEMFEIIPPDIEEQISEIINEFIKEELISVIVENTGEKFNN